MDSQGLKEKYPIISSDYFDEDVYVLLKNECYSLDSMERRCHQLIVDQFVLSPEEAFKRKGEETVIGFLNKIIPFMHEYNNTLDWKKYYSPIVITKQDLEDFIEYASETVKLRKEPLTIREHLKMCRIAVDAAPIYIWPDYVSDAFVVGAEKMFGHLGRLEDELDNVMEVFNGLPEYLVYHPEEMAFGGPYQSFMITDEGWCMMFYESRGKNLSLKRYLELRRHGYPVICTAELLEYVRQMLRDNPNGYSFYSFDD